MSNSIEQLQNRLKDKSLSPEYREVLEKALSEATHGWNIGNYLEVTEDINFDYFGFTLEAGSEVEVIDPEGARFLDVWGSRLPNGLTPTQAAVEIVVDASGNGYEGDIYYVDVNQAKRI